LDVGQYFRPLASPRRLCFYTTQPLLLYNPTMEINSSPQGASHSCLALDVDSSCSLQGHSESGCICIDWIARWFLPTDFLFKQGTTVTNENLGGACTFEAKRRQSLCTRIGFKHIYTIQRLRIQTITCYCFLFVSPSA
jgi:hypothetical protein